MPNDNIHSCPICNGTGELPAETLEASVECRALERAELILNGELSVTLTIEVSPGCTITVPDFHVKDIILSSNKPPIIKAQGRGNTAAVNSLTAPTKGLSRWTSKGEAVIQIPEPEGTKLSRQAQEAIADIEERGRRNRAKNRHPNGAASSPPYRICFHYQDCSEWDPCSYTDLRSAVVHCYSYLHGNGSGSCMYEVYNVKGEIERVITSEYHKNQGPFQVQFQCNDGWDHAGFFQDYEKALDAANDPKYHSHHRAIYRILNAKGKEVRQR